MEILSSLSDLGDNKNLYKSLTDSSEVTEWADGQVSTCTQNNYRFSFDLSKSDTCTKGNCRVNFILIYPADVVVTHITWTNTAETSDEILQADLNATLTDENLKIWIPDDLLMKSMGISFSQESVTICEIIVAGISADEYKCSVGRFLNSDPLQCDLCPVGQYGDEKGLKECKICPDNYKSEIEGSTECTPCDYLKFSSPGNSSCQNCDDTTLLKPSCFLNPRPRAQTTNLVSSSFGPPELRSLEYVDYDGYGVEDGYSIPLNSKDKPFYVDSMVLITNITALQVSVPTINSCTRNTNLNFPNDTLVYTCDEVGLETLIVANISEVKLYKLFVFGIPFIEAPAPPGYFNNGSQFLMCSPGTHSKGGVISECIPCPENYKSRKSGSTECRPCNYLKFSSPGSSSCQDCNDKTLLKPSCFLNPRPRAQTTNLVSSSFGPPELRSLEHEDFEGYFVEDGDSIPLVSENKPFLVESVVLVTNSTRDEVPTINSCTRNTNLKFPNDTLVYTCDKVGLETLIVANISEVKLYKLFVFGIPFIEASAPPGYINNGSQFLMCSPGSYSMGGMVTKCTPCQANQAQPKAGQTSCVNCNEGYYSAIGASSCIKCKANTPQCLTACRSKEEKDAKYGHYFWPTTKPGGVAKSTCAYNADGEAYKQCNQDSKQFEPTDFGECRSKVHEDIERILDEAKIIHNETEQQIVSHKIQSLTQTSSDAMNSEDVKHTAEIIEKLIEFDEGAANKTLDKSVRENILKTVEKVHRSTDEQEIAKFDTASSMRSSIDKFASKVSDDSSANDTDEGLIYLREETMGIVISKKAGAETSFTISGDISNYTQSNLTDDDNDVFFSVNVPADDKHRPVTAVLYNSAAFYPENETVTDMTNALAQIFISSNNSNRVPSKVVSMVTEIKYDYAGSQSTENIYFKSGETVRLKYRVQEENPRVHFKMPFERRFECVFYNTTTKVWVTGDDSGCVTEEEKGGDGETFVSCECSHMTSFAVLMSLETDYDPIEATVTTILMGISLGCLFLTIIAYLPSKKFLKRESVRINLFLVTSLIFSIIVFYFMELVVSTNFKEQNVPYESDQASVPCFVISCLMNYFWLCQMAWMVCEAVVLYKAVVVIMDPHVHRYMLKFNLFGWGLPVIFPAAGVGWGRADFANPKTCFVREKYGIATFYAPVVLCILFNSIIFTLIIRARLKERTTNQGNSTGGSTNQKDAQKRELKIIVSVMTWLGIAWVFGFFLMFQDTNAIWLRWIFIVFNSTQGIFIFILYVVSNEDIKKVWKELLHISPSEKPSNSSNLRSKANTGRSKGKGTKTTSGGNTCTLTKSVTEMDVEPLYSTLPGQSASEIDCTSPLLITSSIVVGNKLKSSAPPRVYKTKVGPGGVHIYDNFALTLSNSINKKITDSDL